MAKDTGIEWCDHTFNPWRGCTKVSSGCANCYAEVLSKRNPQVLGVWGDDGTRVIAAESYWREPAKWNAAAEKAGKRRRVFCLSLGDFWEDREDLLVPRWRMLSLIQNTPWLDWLLLTKRPENILRLLREHWESDDDFGNPKTVTVVSDMLGRWINGQPPANVWLGTSVENQATADERIPHLLKVPAAVRFLSCEPLLGPIDFSIIQQKVAPGYFGDPLTWHHRGKCHKDAGIVYPSINWVIVGGESGGGARPCNVEWIRSIRDQCRAAGVPCFIKQLGTLPHYGLEPRPVGPPVYPLMDLNHYKGGDMAEWPEDLRVREFPKGVLTKQTTNKEIQQ